MRSAFGRVSSSGTFPATAVIPSILSSGERIASSRANASSTPGSVSMMTRDWPGEAGVVSRLDSALELGVSPANASPAAEVATKSRRVMSDGLFMKSIPLFFGQDAGVAKDCHEALHSSS